MTRPSNPVAHLRTALSDIYNHIGEEEAGPLLASKFGASKPEDVNAGLLINAIDALHQHADFLAQPKDPPPAPEPEQQADAPTPNAQDAT